MIIRAMNHFKARFLRETRLCVEVALLHMALWLGNKQQGLRLARRRNFPEESPRVGQFMNDGKGQREVNASGR